MSLNTEIPAELCTALKIREALTIDLRSDEEIISSLLTPQPIISEKNVWAFWDKGFSEMPAWSQRNVINWVRLLGSEWNVRVLDKVETSPLNTSRYVDEALLPDSFKTGTMDGPFVGQHSADLVRCPCLFLYGGVWLDVGIILLMHLDDLCWNSLEDPGSPYELCIPHVEERRVGNWFVAARKGNTFVQRWHQVFLRVWKNQTNCFGAGKHALLQPVGSLILPEGMRDAISPPVDLAADYGSQMLAFSRVRLLKDPSDGLDGVQYFERKVLLFDAIRESFAAQKLSGWNGSKEFELLTTPRDAHDGQRYKEADKFFWTLLSQTAMLKVYRAPGLSKHPALGELLDRNENHDADSRPGTFGEMLRYGSVHFRQTRTVEPITIPPNSEDVINAGLLDVI